MCILCNIKNKKKYKYIHLHSCSKLKNIIYKLEDIEYFNCSFTNLKTIKNLQHNTLKYLLCKNNYVTNIMYNFLNLIELSIENTTIKTLPDTLNKLKILNISNTLIKYLPNNLNNLELLNADYSKLIILPINLFKIKKLFILKSNIKILPINMYNLEYLDCSYTDIISIPDYLIKLKSLVCQNTNINVLSKNFANLEYLNCNNTNIYKISDKYVLLKELYILNTNIIVLSHKYKNLRTVYKNNMIITDKYQVKLYLTINFLLYHFKTKFKYIRKYKCITKINIQKYINLILDTYINPNSLALLYKVTNFDKYNKELVYLNKNNHLKVLKFNF